MWQTKAFWAQVSKKLSKEQIEAVFAKFDGNGDGKLSKEEFQQLMAAKKWLISMYTAPNSSDMYLFPSLLLNSYVLMYYTSVNGQSWQ